MANALLSIQIIPKVDDQDLYSYVDEAIAVIEAANVKYSSTSTGKQRWKANCRSYYKS